MTSTSPTPAPAPARSQPDSTLVAPLTRDDHPAPTVPAAPAPAGSAVPAGPPAHAPEPASEPASEPLPRPAAWWSPSHVLFRFVCVYFVLYTLPFPLGRVSWHPIGEIPVPGADTVARWLQQASQWLAAQWTAMLHWTTALVNEHVLGRAQPLVRATTGSGDQLASYVTALTLAGLALVGAGVWTMIARRRADPDAVGRKLWRVHLGYSSRGSGPHPLAHGLLRVYLRYSLGIWLLVYGFAKVTQFPLPYDHRMFTTFGEMSPMGVLWKFMGYSYPYTLLTGVAEASAGLLLFWRRTTPLGAMLATACMINVTALNFCYDTPVKLFSLHLLAMAVILLLPDLRRIAAVLLWNRAAPPRALGGRFRRWWVRWPVAGLKYALIVCFLWPQVRGAGNSLQARSAPPPPMTGIYRVEEFVRDGAVVAAFTDPARWRHVIVRRAFTRGRPVAASELSVTIRRTDEQSVFWSRSQLDSEERMLRLRVQPPPVPPPRPDVVAKGANETKGAAATNDATETKEAAATKQEAATKETATKETAAAREAQETKGAADTKDAKETNDGKGAGEARDASTATKQSAAPPAPALRSADLVYDEPAPGRLILQGTYEGAAIRVTLQRMEPEDFPLLARPFAWIQEAPFNR